MLNMINHRAPVVIFLSDGEASIADEQISRLCNLCAQWEYVILTWRGKLNYLRCNSARR
jgi:hypothetical protein